MRHNPHLRDERGFTLIELLIAIVVVGVLTAVAIVGIGGLTNSGEEAACNASRDAAKAAIAVHYANANTYPSSFQQLVDAKELDVPSSVDVNGSTMSNGDKWSLTLEGGQPPTITPCPDR
jgi:prepilin-type N-terminal cleavage/methylation domain-containing protein